MIIRGRQNRGHDVGGSSPGLPPLPDRAGAHARQLHLRTLLSDGRASASNARIVIDCYVGEQRRYHGLVGKALPPASDWQQVTGTFELPEDVRLTRILLYRNGKGTAWFDDVRLSRQGAAQNLITNGDFDGMHSWRVFFRKQGQQSWQAVDAVVFERFHNVIFLEPQTNYEFLVRQVTADGSVRAESQILAASTRAQEPRQWHDLCFGSEQRAPTPPSTYPCVESAGGKLYFCDSRAGILWLTELNDELRAHWTKEWVAPYPVDGRPCYQGQTQNHRLEQQTVRFLETSPPW